MSLTIPRSASDKKRTSARLDLLPTIISSPVEMKESLNDASPRDSLSPLDDRREHESEDRGRSRKAVELPRSNTSCTNLGSSSLLGRQAEAGSREAQTQQELHITFQGSQEKHEVATSPSSTLASSPRSPLIIRDNRPSDLRLTQTNGLTKIPVHELKQQIRNGHTDTCATITEVPRRRPKRYPKSPIVMGNKPSSLAGSPEPGGDDSSVRSVVRNPVRILRKSSTNLFKRIDSKSPLPSELTSTVIQVHQQVSPTTFDGVQDENDESPVDPFMDRNQSSKSPDVLPQLHSASTVTVTDSNTLRPLSASMTIREPTAHSRRGSRVDTRTSFIEELGSETDSKPKQQSTIPPKRDSALSPSLPAPSPLPEDSPHKYGLKDRMETPEIPEPEKISVVKARRKSTGVDIFNEAKSLQSASSFLNGLSTSRRRAESTQRSTETSGLTHASYDTRCPSSARLSSAPPSRPTSTGPPNTYSLERRRGHTFKPSGFAYTRPLTIAQMKCYLDHKRLLPSRNKIAPVECSVCHIDDDQDHFSCSWCALRMCRFCRKDFAERGMTALKERIKQAELGGSSPSGSTESLGGGRRGRRAFV